MLFHGKIDRHVKNLLAQLYSRTVRDTPSGRRLDFFENKLRLAKLSLRLKARESLSTETRNGLASNFFSVSLSQLACDYIYRARQQSYILRHTYWREQVDTSECTKYVSSTIRVAALNDSRAQSAK